MNATQPAMGCFCSELGTRAGRTRANSRFLGEIENFPPTADCFMRSSSRWLLVSVVLAAPFLSSEDSAALEIVRRCMTKDQNNWQQARNYTYLKRSEEKELDNNGGVKSTERRPWMSPSCTASDIGD